MLEYFASDQVTAIVNAGWFAGVGFGISKVIWNKSISLRSAWSIRSASKRTKELSENLRFGELISRDPRMLVSEVRDQFLRMAAGIFLIVMPPLEIFIISFSANELPNRFYVWFLGQDIIFVIFGVHILIDAFWRIWDVSGWYADFQGRRASTIEQKIRLRRILRKGK